MQDIGIRQRRFNPLIESLQCLTAQHEMPSIDQRFLCLLARGIQDEAGTAFAGHLRSMIDQRRFRGCCPEIEDFVGGGRHGQHSKCSMYKLYIRSIC
jgi:hypothetical protein